jgi:CheY-like chemotaxis protein
MAVFAMTGWGQEEDRRKSAEAGFDGHLVKPVDPVTVLELLNAPSRCENAVTTDSRDGLGR